MHWFRNNLRQGSWLALLALTINLALSYGHVHAIGGKATAPNQIALTSSSIFHVGTPTQSHDSDSQTDDLCPICMAAHAIGSAVASAPPALPVRLAIATVVSERATQFATTELKRAAFQSRAPPLS